jgi:hypothetical protein
MTTRAFCSEHSYLAKRLKEMPAREYATRQRLMESSRSMTEKRVEVFPESEEKLAERIKQQYRNHEE